VKELFAPTLHFSDMPTKATGPGRTTRATSWTTSFMPRCRSTTTPMASFWTKLSCPSMAS
jgi:hypothetical protein